MYIESEGMFPLFFYAEQNGDAWQFRAMTAPYPFRYEVYDYIPMSRYEDGEWILDEAGLLLCESCGSFVQENWIAND